MWSLRRLFRKAGEVAVPPPRVLRVFLVRTGVYQEAATPPQTWDVTELGREQARLAGLRIKERTGNEKVTVFLDPERPASYRTTSLLIAEELGVRPVSSDVRRPPSYAEISWFEKWGGPVVIVTPGSALGYALHTYPGPAVKIGFMGPPFGSVHELRIEYREDATGFRILSRTFV